MLVLPRVPAKPIPAPDTPPQSPDTSPVPPATHFHICIAPANCPSASPAGSCQLPPSPTSAACHCQTLQLQIETPSPSLHSPHTNSHLGAASSPTILLPPVLIDENISQNNTRHYHYHSYQKRRHPDHHHHLQQPAESIAPIARSSNRLAADSPITTRARARVPTLTLSVVRRRRSPLSLPIESTLDSSRTTTTPTPTTTTTAFPPRPPFHGPDPHPLLDEVSRLLWRLPAPLPLCKRQANVANFAVVAPTAACATRSPRLPTSSRAPDPPTRPP